MKGWYWQADADADDQHFTLSAEPLSHLYTRTLFALRPPNLSGVVVRSQELKIAGPRADCLPTELQIPSIGEAVMLRMGTKSATPNTREYTRPPAIAWVSATVNGAITLQIKAGLYARGIGDCRKHQSNITYAISLLLKTFTLLSPVTLEKIDGFTNCLNWPPNR